MRRQSIPLPPAIGHLVLNEPPRTLALLVLELGNLQDDRDLLGTGAMAPRQPPILDRPLARIRRPFPMMQTTSYWRMEA
jgi:hypothetical protein